MSYELINQELNLWSCSISDLTMSQVKCFLGQWSKGSAISSLTVFYESSVDKIVINKDLTGFNTYIKLILDYFSLSEDERQDYKNTLDTLEFEVETSKRNISDFIDVLDTALILRKMREVKRLLGKQSCRLNKIKEFDFLMNRREHRAFIPVDLYNYGYIEGIRAERARRKAKQKGVATR